MIKTINNFLDKLLPYYKSIRLTVTILIIVILLITSLSYSNKYKKIKKDYNISLVNIEAMANENSILNKDIIMMNFTVAQLNYYNDSITDKLNQARRHLKIKDNEIKSLQYFKEDFNKTDTITLGPDTIFVKNLHIDTTIVDTFYTCKLKLDYPNRVIISPSFINEKMVFVSTQKQTIKPPKKYWVQRIFQKKHLVLTIDVEDSNPFMKTSQTRFIKIID